MAHRLKTPEGRKLYALRKQTPEPVFCITKSALGFRQFRCAAPTKMRGEWSLVTMARMDPRDHGVEFKEHVRPLPRVISRKVSRTRKPSFRSDPSHC